ncbi:MAG TPA: response regulator [Steroidobacteraceae bacterium]|nr:response regulator [Steroidobacteraceae bacterium]
MTEPVDAGARSAPGGLLRLVIGENNSDLAMTMTMLLDAEPDIRCVATAGSTAAVLDAIEAHSPNAFVLDLSLDDGSSLPLIATLRSRLPKAVIVVHTGYKSAVIDQQCVSCGADAVVLKSGDIDLLTAALRQAALRQARA